METVSTRIPQLTSRIASPAKQKPPTEVLRTSVEPVSPKAEIQGSAIENPPTALKRGLHAAPSHSNTTKRLKSSTASKTSTNSSASSRALSRSAGASLIGATARRPLREATGERRAVLATKDVNKVSTAPKADATQKTNSKMAAPAGKAGPKKRPVWDTKGRLEDMESAYSSIQDKFDSMSSEKNTIRDLLASEQLRCEVADFVMTCAYV